MPAWNDQAANLPDRETAIRNELNATGGSQTLSQILANGHDAGGVAITNLADPSSTQDAATKNYVDTHSGGTNSFASTTMASASTGATSITVTSQPSWFRVGQRVVLDPYTSICESVVIKTIAGSTIGLMSALANNHANNTIIYCPVQGVFDVEWWGANGKNGTGNEVPINAAAAAAGNPGTYGNVVGGTVYIPRGNYLTAGEILFDSYVNIVGDGRDASIISPNGDLGTGKYALKCTAPGNGRNIVRDIGWVISGTRTTGTPPNNMSGLLIGSSSTVEQCRASGFYANIDIQGNHTTLRNLLLTTAYYNIYVHGNANGLGNLYFYEVDMEGTAWAAVGISGDATIDSSWIENVDIGKGPFGFYKETYIDHGFITNTVIQGIGIEQCGNGVFYNQPDAGSAFSGNVIRVRYANAAFDATVYQLNPVTYPPAIFTGACGANDMDAYSLGNFGSWLSGPWWNAGNMGSLEHATTLFASLRTASKTMFPNNVGNPYYWRDKGGEFGRFEFVQSPGSVTLGQLVQINADSTGRYVNAYSSGIPFGFALMAGSTNDCIPIQTRGVVAVTVPATGTVTAPCYLKPSATAGSVQAATGFSDGPIVGVAMSSGTNTNINVLARCE